MNVCWATAWGLVGACVIAEAASAEPNANVVQPAPQAQGAPQARGGFDRLPSQPEARFALARRYEVGNGTRKDPYLAAHWARLAAEAGSVPAAEWLKAAAEGGSPFAQLHYASLLKDGVGTKRDSKAAEAWAGKALAVLQPEAKAQNAEAAMAMGFAYARQLGVKADDKDEAAWLWIAAHKLYAPAMGAWAYTLLIGKGAPANPTTAVQLLEGAITLGHFESARDLGGAYLDGKFLAKDNERAVKWLKLAAYNGDRESQFTAAHLLAEADGVAQDDATAVELYQLAAAQGSAGAANNLGLLVRDGRGTTADAAAAIEWFKKADALGSPFGAYNLGRTYRDGLGVKVDLAEAKVWLARAAKAGPGPAKQELVQLEATRACLKGKSSALLFGEALRCPRRSSLRRSIVNGGARATREDDRYWYDAYDSSQVLEGSQRLSVGYDNAGEFAHAEYIFPGGEIRDVARMVGIKYGVWKRSSGSLAVGPAAFEWTLPDGIVVRVSRGWPDTSTSLEYFHPARLAQLKREQAAEDTRKRVEQSVAQSNAF